MNVLIALLVLGVLILIHEAGHFLAATTQGIRVNGFSIGFGPALFKKEFNGVTYAIRALPLGGFVSFPDDEEKNISKDDPNLLSNRPLAQRALVISAGVLANLLLAWLVLFGQATIYGLPSQPDPGVVVIAVERNEQAAKAGLVAGDRIFRIDGVALGKGQQAVEALVSKVQSSAGKTLSIERDRNGQQEKISITPNNFQGSGKIGAQLQPSISSHLRAAKGPGEVLIQTNKQFTDLVSRTINGYKGLITEFKSTAKQLSGPVKIVEIGSQLSGQGVSGIILFTALISVNLAVLNALPLPLLDGGQLALLIFEAIRGKPVPQKLQLAIMQSGFVLMVGLSLVLIIRDTTQLTVIQELLGN